MNNNIVLKGHIGHENGFFYVNMYTCTGRCIKTTTKNSLKTEIDKCCDTVKFMLDKESQSKVTHFDIIYFTILDGVEELVDDHLGLYAKFMGK